MAARCNGADCDLLSTVRKIEAAVAANVKLTQSYRVEYGGQFESEAEASRGLLVLGALVIVAIFLILATAFRSTRDALIVMLNLPLALVGGVAGVYLAGGVLSVASIIGFITLFGIATRNGIMLVAHIRHLREAEGVTDLREAVSPGASERLAPILMTALAPGLALVPIAAGMGKPGSEIQAPMAMVILSGLFTSTALNMVADSAVCLAAGRRRSRAGSCAGGPSGAVGSGATPLTRTGLLLRGRLRGPIQPTFRIADQPSGVTDSGDRTVQTQSQSIAFEMQPSLRLARRKCVLVI